MTRPLPTQKQRTQAARADKATDNLTAIDKMVVARINQEAETS